MTDEPLQHRNSGWWAGCLLILVVLVILAGYAGTAIIAAITLERICP